MSSSEDDVSRWHPVGRLQEFSARRGTLKRVRNERLAIFRFDNEVFAIADRCPHASSSLCTGVFKGLVVACSRHRWLFNVKTGKCLTNDLFEAKTYPIKIERGQVFVELPEESDD